MANRPPVCLVELHASCTGELTCMAFCMRPESCLCCLLSGVGRILTGKGHLDDGYIGGLDNGFNVHHWRESATPPLPSGEKSRKYRLNRTYANTAVNGAAAYVVTFGGYSKDTNSVIGSVNVLLCWKNDYESLAGGGEESTLQQPYTFNWICPRLPRSRQGTGAPAARMAHAACIVPRPASNGGPVMIMYGGMDVMSNVFDDVWALHVADLRNVHWEEVVVDGASPGARHSHSLTDLKNSDGQVTHLVLIGGVDVHDAVPMGIWLLHLEEMFRNNASRSPLRLRWSRVSTPQDGLFSLARHSHTCKQVSILK